MSDVLIQAQIATWRSILYAIKLKVELLVVTLLDTRSSVITIRKVCKANKIGCDCQVSVAASVAPTMGEADLVVVGAGKSCILRLKFRSTADHRLHRMGWPYNGSDLQAAEPTG